MGIFALQNSAEIYYETFDGDPSLPVLVFLHEGLGCTAMWDQFIRTLCRSTGHPGMAYDRQGYGQSSALTQKRTLDYLHDYAFEELPQVLGTVIPGREYILVGHSDGGSIALLHASENPSGLRSAVTSAAHVFCEDVTLEGIRAATLAFKAGKLQGLYRFHSDKTDTIFYAWSDTWLAPHFKQWNMEDCLRDIRVPVLVMQGKDDQYATLKQVEAICEQVSGPARPGLIDNCGHSPHQDQPDAVTALIADFIQAP